MTPALILGLATRVWPAVVGVASAIVFVSQKDYPSAAQALFAGLVGGHILHASTAPAVPPPAK
jgi:hypothetical protein